MQTSFVLIDPHLQTMKPIVKRLQYRSCRFKRVKEKHIVCQQRVPIRCTGPVVKNAEAIDQSQPGYAEAIDESQPRYAEGVG